MYSDDLPLSQELKQAHESAFDTIGKPGPSWTGADRIGMVAAAREALDCDLCQRRSAALSPNDANGTHSSSVDLDAPVVDAIHRISTDPGRLTRSWFDTLTDETLTQPAYVELVSVVTSSVIIDTLHRSVGLAVADLGTPQPGEPTHDPLGDTLDEGAWVPISRAPRDMADTGLPQVPNIFRAMGLVPSAVGLFFSTFRPHYALKDIPLAISQAQAEFVASRVSALNQCFY